MFSIGNYVPVALTVVFEGTREKLFVMKVRATLPAESGAQPTV